MSLQLTSAELLALIAAADQFAFEYSKNPEVLEEAQRKMEAELRERGFKEIDGRWLNSVSPDR